ncbi:MAG: glycosyltransferase [Gammaproteobacteria bacterium]
MRACSTEPPAPADAPDLSVVLCTHDPRAAFLARTLDHLRAQTLPVSRWELLVVDNASRPPVTTDMLAWHPRGRVVREEKLGLVWARGCGANAARGTVLVFVDDDNLLAPDYLATVETLFAAHPGLGCAGARIEPEFESRAPGWLARWRNYLALRDFGDTEIVRDELNWGPWCPIGAGMAVRRPLFLEHWSDVLADTERQRLGRRGRGLASAEDADLVFGILRRGHQTGYFPQLGLRHLIPRERLAFAYVCRLVHHVCRSNVVVRRANRVRPLSSLAWRRALTEIFSPRIRGPLNRLASWLIVLAGIAGEARGYLRS